MDVDDSSYKFNIKMCILFHIAVLAIVLNLAYGVSDYINLSACILAGVLLSGAYFCSRHRLLKYILSAASLLLLVSSILYFKFGTHHFSCIVFIAPVLYACLLPDIFSPIVVGIVMAFLLINNNNGAISNDILAGMVLGTCFTGVLLSYLSFKVRNYIKQSDKYREISVGLQHENEGLQYGVLHDGLTGLPNRNYIMNEIAKAIGKKKQVKNYSFAIAFIDLDRFKVINDSLGHDFGDKLLIEVSKRVKTCLRSTDSVARMGGDEFVIFLDDVKSSNDAEYIIDRVLTELKKPFYIKNNEISTSASIGIVFSNNEYEMPGEYLRYADITMYRAKTDGKGRWEVFDSNVRQHAMKNLKLENDLKYAVQKEQLRVFYQPIFSIGTFKITGFEALLRWEHPQLGLILPAEFIPLAEETGLIVPIGEWVLNEACKQAVEWQMKMECDMPLAINVNISPVQLSQLQLVGDINEIIKSTGMVPENLRIEITEGAIIKDIRTSRYMLEQIKNLGVKICIDDFGTGYSSLGYLNQFPFDALKIDQSFVQQIKGSDGLLKEIVHLAHELNMSVIGEGIESLEQMKRLGEYGCEFGQGYYFSGPVDRESAERMLKEHPVSAYQ